MESLTSVVAGSCQSWRRFRVRTDPSATESGLRVCIGRPGARQLERGLRRLRNIIVSQTTPPASTHSR